MPTKALLIRLAPYIGLGAIVIALFWGERIVDLFRLDPTDTVYDYNRASVEDQVRFLMRACNMGDCLTRRDWACGFAASGDVKAFDDCFLTAVDRAKPWVRLDAVRKFCGNQTMEFAGYAYSNPERCKEAGGQWGVRSSPPHIPF
jgi:hypothetical protein